MTSRKLYLNQLMLLMAFFAFPSQLLLANDNEIIETTALNKIINDKEVQKRVIVLYVSAPFCRYCKKLEVEILNPLLRSGNYEKKILLRKFNIDSKKKIVGFYGILKKPKEFMNEYGVSITPTLLFLDHKGNQLSEAITGYTNDEFFWYYLDNAIKESNKQLLKNNN